jgi:Protein of unknown function (DUF3558)
MKPLAVAVSLLAAVLLGGCGGSSATSTGTPTPSSTPKGGTAAIDPCTLVTAAQASAIVGANLTKSDNPPAGAGVTSTCEYSAAGGASFLVGAGRIPNVAKVASLQHSMVKAVSGELPVTGLGDQAGESKDQFGVKIAFFKGEAFVFLDALSPTLSADAMAPRVESLARTIFAKL